MKLFFLLFNFLVRFWPCNVSFGHTAFSGASFFFLNFFFLVGVERGSVMLLDEEEEEWAMQEMVGVVWAEVE